MAISKRFRGVHAFLHFFAGVVILAIGGSLAADPHPAWGDDEAMEPFIDDLLGRMTLEEKIGQLVLFSTDWTITGPSIRDGYREDIRAGRVGAMFNAFTAEFTRSLQEIASRKRDSAFPCCSVTTSYTGTARYSRSRWVRRHPGISKRSRKARALRRRKLRRKACTGRLHQCSTLPAIRAGDECPKAPGKIRTSAHSSEQPECAASRARICAHSIRCSRPPQLIHFAAYGAAQAGRDYHTTNMSDRELRSVHLPPFKAAFDAGAGSVMTSFNEINGVPATGSRYLLTDVLRDEWGFEGFVVTDYTSINEMVLHGFARDEKHAGEIAMDAGVDMDLQGAVFMEHLRTSVDDGAISEAQVEAATRRILEMKYRLGLFDDPYRYSDPARQKAEVYKPAHLEAARDVARRSMVLLKNDDNTLPLADNVGSIALIGPLADSKADLIGSWAAAGDRNSKPVSVLEALRDRVGDDVDIRFAAGASYEFGAEPDEVAFAAALEAANASDVVIAVMGERWDMTGEAASRTSLKMPGTQMALLRELHETGKPIVLVLMNGRPLALEWADSNVAAILEAWYPGTMGGPAVVDVLFGDYNPSGKLPVTFPRNVGQVPIFYSMKNTGRPYTADKQGQKYLSRYLVTPNSPLYPFGYGLSYTSFAYSDFEIEHREIGVDDTLQATVTVTNTGPVAGEEVVQLYVQDVVGSVTRPVKELKRFEKISLTPGESRKVTFALTAEDLAFYRHDMSFGAEPGEFRLYVGGSSDDVSMLDFELLDDAERTSRVAER